jgi:hypothetical protein
MRYSKSRVELENLETAEALCEKVYANGADEGGDDRSPVGARPVAEPMNRGAGGIGRDDERHQWHLDKRKHDEVEDDDRGDRRCGRGARPCDQRKRGEVEGSRDAPRDAGKPRNPRRLARAYAIEQRSPLLPGPRPPDSASA